MNQEKGLAARLSLMDAILLVIGSVVGSGIFLTSGIIAGALPDAGLILLVWFFGMILILFGGLTLAELGTMMPEAGGHYVYLRKAYGPLAGFLFSWMWMLVVQTGGVAALSVGFAEYLSYFFPSLSLENYFINFSVLKISFGHMVAVLSIGLLTVVNYFGIKSGSILQNIFTIVKIIAIAILVIAGLVLIAGSETSFSAGTALPTPSGSALWSAIGISLIAVLWTFDGWYAVNIVASEIKNVRRNLPLSLIIGILLTGIIYLLVNWFYIQSMPMSEMAGTVRIGEKSATALFGQGFGGIMSGLILISIFGCLSATIIYGPRVFFAVAKDGLFFRAFAQVHPKYRTPSHAIIWQGIWAAVLCLSGTYEQLYTYVIFVLLIFYIALGLAVIKLRKTSPDIERPYKVWGYPVVPVLFALAMFWIMINTLVEKPVESMIGLFLVLTGLPIYFYWKNRSKA